jgi:50S ribosomal subunit-associated GTPase HflX
VLTDLGVADRPRITCYNKMDRVPRAGLDTVLRLHAGSLAISALDEIGLDELAAHVSRGLSGKRETVSWQVPYSRWDVVFEIRRAGVVRDEKHGDESALITCELKPEDVARFSRVLGSKPL